jgi:rhodanese-related sulfurtransferase
MVREITPRQLKARLDAGERPLILDVREQWELDIAKLEGAVHIPMNTIPERLGELPRDQEIVVMCHSGGRSLRVAQYLEKNGFASPVNLAGGIAGWAEEVDPSLATY